MPSQAHIVKGEVQVHWVHVLVIVWLNYFLCVVPSDSMRIVYLYIDGLFEPVWFSTSSIWLENSACTCTCHMRQRQCTACSLQVMYTYMNHMLALSKPSSPPHLVTMICLGYALAYHPKSPSSKEKSKSIGSMTLSLSCWLICVWCLRLNEHSVPVH